MFKHLDRVVYTGVTNTAIYPRTATPPQGTLGTYISEPHWYGSYITWDSGHRTESHDCNMSNVQHISNQHEDDDNMLAYPVDSLDTCKG